MTTRPETAGAPPAEVNQRGVLCARCDHMNPAGADECRRCGAELFRDCPSCGETIQRIYSRCSKCHHRLPQRRFLFWGRSRSKPRARRSNVQRVGRRFLYSMVALGLLFGAAAVLLKYLKP